MIMMKGGKGCYEGIALKNLKKEDVMKSKTMFVVLAGMVVSFIFLAVFAPGQASAQMKLQLSLGGVTGTNYMIGAPLAKYINENSKTMAITPNTSGGEVENIRRVDAGLAQLGMTTPPTMYQAWNSEKPFEKPARNWRVIGVSSQVMANHVVSLAQYNVKTVSDLKGKIFAIGAPGSGAAVGMLLFLEHAGLKKDIDARMLPHQDYPTMLIDGKIHAFNRLGAVPAAVVDEIGTQKAISLVDFRQEIEKTQFLKKYPYYQKVVIKPNTYKGESREVIQYGPASFLIAHKDVPENIIYEFTKLAYSDQAVKMVDMAFKGQNLDRKNPFEGNIGPIHPGAAKYFKEIGVTIPEPFLK
jgi:TRAP transporter TAXI family solute receptor